MLIIIKPKLSNFVDMSRFKFTVVLLLIFYITFMVESKLFYLTKENGKMKVNSGSSIESIISTQSWLSIGEFKDDITNTGFAYLEIESNPKVNDHYEAYAAGYLEGNITSELIYSHWYNTVRDFKTTKNATTIGKIDEFLRRNSDWVRNQTTNNKNDPYWYHVGLFYSQLQGIFEGYNGYKGSNSEKYYLTYDDFLWLTLYYDLTDLYDALGQENLGEGHCSVLVKILPENKDIYFGHNTWVTFQSMLRFQKKYILHFKKSPDSTQSIPGTAMTFTGYPGAISSLDDFYLISSGLATTETTNEIFNRSLRTYTTPQGVMENVRSLVANRLAVDGESWSNIFKLYNSGTENNQWMILDYKKFKSGQTPDLGTFWVAEQMPSKLVANDLTSVLIEKGYWTSYNIPYYKEIYEITGYKQQYEKFGDWFSHSNAPRAKIFRRDHTNVNNMTTFMDLMRSNDYINDPASFCKCSPPFSAAGAIAGRNDLDLANGTYQTKIQGHSPFGAIDAKITNSSLFLKLQFIAISGPTTGTNAKLPVFDWSKSGFNKTPHLSHPNVWNFKPILYNWKIPLV